MAVAQKIEVPRYSFKNLVKVADASFAEHSWEVASAYYEAAFNKRSDSYCANQIATCAFNNRDFVKAETWFNTLLGMNAPMYPKAGFYYGLSLKANSKYADAKKALNNFKKSYNGPDKVLEKKIVDAQVKGCDFALNTMAHPDTVRIIHLGSNVNSPFTDAAPVPYGDTALIWSSLKSDTLINYDQLKSSNNNFLQFYVVDKINDSTYGEGRYLKQLPFNEDKTFNSNGAFSQDGKRFYFVRGKMDDHQVFSTAIYECTFDKGKWNNPKQLGGEVNMPGSNNSHPTIGENKYGEVLYFDSDRPGGEGGKDIWFSIRGKDGNFSPAVNAGKKINTPGDEVTPYYDAKNYILYFSSDGLSGMGGLDIFKAQGFQKKWATPTNMGYPVNSALDDFYYILDGKHYTGYLVSNRPGIFHVKDSQTCCDDIWRVIYPRQIYYAVRGKVFNSKTHQPIAGADLKIVIKDTLFHQEMSKSDDQYFYDTKAGRTYTIRLQDSGYHDTTATFHVTQRDYNDTLTVNLYLRPVEKVTIVLKNIFFDFDHKDAKMPESKKSLDTLITFMKSNPDLRVLIRSHTDHMGSLDYNMALSAGRAAWVTHYLIQNGIDSSRLESKGMAFLEPRVAEIDSVTKQDCPQCRALNRRTDFTVLGTVPGVIINYKDGDLNFDPDKPDTLDEQQQQDKKNQDK